MLPLWLRSTADPPIFTPDSVDLIFVHSPINYICTLIRIRSTLDLLLLF